MAQMRSSPSPTIDAVGEDTAFRDREELNEKNAETTEEETEMEDEDVKAEEEVEGEEEEDQEENEGEEDEYEDEDDGEEEEATKCFSQVHVMPVLQK